MLRVMRKMKDWTAVDYIKYAALLLLVVVTVTVATTALGMETEQKMLRY